MNGLVRNVFHQYGTSPSGSARLTNFNPDRIVFVFSQAGGFAKSNLSYLKMTMNFKNSVGSSVAICANLPLNIVADLSDYENGYGFIGSDNTVAFALDIGKYCLRADDEITFNFDCSTTFGTDIDMSVIAIDSHIGKEKLVSYKYIEAQASQAYQNADVVSIYGKMTSPSTTVFITTDDFFGSNTISEIAVVGIGAALGRSEDMDSFGVVWDDDTGLTQPVTVRAGSSNEIFLVKCWNFDANRIGYERPEYNSAKLLASSIQTGNPSKAKCLKYFYG